MQETFYKSESWSKVKKLQVVAEFFEQNITVVELAEKYGLTRLTVHRWINEYRSVNPKLTARK